MAISIVTEALCGGRYNHLYQMIIEIRVKLYFFIHKSKIYMQRKQLDLGKKY